MNRKSAHAIDKHVGNRLRMCRIVLHMSQEHLGEKLGISFQRAMLSGMKKKRPDNTPKALERWNNEAAHQHRAMPRPASLRSAPATPLS